MASDTVDDVYAESAPTEPTPTNVSLRPGILVFLWIVFSAFSPFTNVVLSKWVSAASFASYYHTISGLFVFCEVAAVWWLALLVPHSKRSIAVLLSMVLLPLIFNLSIFFGFPDPSAAYYLFLFQVVQSLSYDAVIYCMLTLFSHLTAIGLVRHDTSPTIARLGVAKIMWITVVVAASLGLFQILPSAAEDSPFSAAFGGTKGIQTVFALFGALPLMVVTWLSVCRKRFLVLAFVVNLIIALLTYEALIPYLWKQFYGEESIVFMSWQQTILRSLFLTFSLLLGVWICNLCGYRLARLEFESGELDRIE